MNVFDLFAKLSLDTSEYEEGLNDAEKKGSNFGAGISKATKAVGVGLAAVGTASVAAGAALLKGAGDVASYGDNIDKMSQKMGISAQAYQEWDAIMQHSGTSIEALKPSMKTLANAAVEGSEEFEKLGLSLDEVQSMSQEDLFATVISRLQSMEEGTERTAITSKLLGRGATELGALLNTSAEETEAMRQRVHELGGVMSDEAVKSAAAYQDSLQDMKTGFAGLKRNLMGDFLPSITKVMDGLGDLFAGDYDEGLDNISKGVDMVIKNISEMLPRIIKLGGQIIKSLAQSIVQNIPQLMPAITDLVMDISKFIIDNLPMIVQTGMDIIVQLAFGIAGALPELIPTIVDVILEIVDTLINNVDLLIDAAVAIIIGLANGLIAAVPKLVEKAPQIVLSLVKAIIEAVPQLILAGAELVANLIIGIGNAFADLIKIGGEFITKIKEGFKQKIEDAKNWGKDLIKNFKEGITQKWEDLKSGVKGIAEGIKGFLGFSEPDEGPLSNFHTYAPDMMKLFAKGIKDNENLVYDQIEDSFDFGNKLGDMGELGVSANAEQTINHTGTIRLEGVNDKDEFVAASEYAIEDIVVSIMKRQARLA